MIQCRLRELIGAKARQERRRITYDDIQAQTGVNKNTLTNDRAGGSIGGRSPMCLLGLPAR